MMGESSSVLQMVSLVNDKNKRQLAAQSLLLSRQAEERTTEYYIAGNCMTPIFIEGDSITVQPSEKFIAGDIVVYSDSKRGQVVHRVLGNLSIAGVRKYLVASDDAKYPDPLIPTNQLLGKVVQVNGLPAPVAPFTRIRSFYRFVYWILRLAFRKRIFKNLRNY